jgi:putative DNA primase/helicase
MSRTLDADVVHAEVIRRGGWSRVLWGLGIDESFLTGKHGPCPVCGGKDRFRFTDWKQRGGFFCNGCGSGDGFALLTRVHRWGFAEAVRRVAEAIGMTESQSRFRTPLPPPPEKPNPDPAQPTTRVRALLRDSCDVSLVDPVVQYLEHRRVWPLPRDCSLRAHAAAEYWEGRECVGAFPALLAPVVDIDGALVTLHVTYLELNGQKLANREPRKILSPLTGREGCAVRLMSATDVLGIAEGIETALSAAKLNGVPTWAALNATLLGKFEPPMGVNAVHAFADRDIKGLEAFCRLIQRLQGRVHVESRLPPASANDWNDVLQERLQ